MMISMQGKGVSKGVAEGPLYFLHRRESAVSRQHADDAEAEKQRFFRAQRTAAERLAALTEKTRAEAGDEAALLFETHAMLIEDEDYVEFIQSALENEGCNAEFAVQQAGEEFAAMFAAMEDAYMRARAADIRDVSRRIIDNLRGFAEDAIDSEEPVILAADDLLPSETMRLDKQKILGFITREGSVNSHTAILARAMGIPAICGLGERLNEYCGRRVCMDGETGRIILDPDETTRTAFREKFENQQEKNRLLETMKGKEDITLDGREINIYCNIGSPEDISVVLDNDGRGIGLFRTEFLFMASGEYPTEEAQFQAYKTVAAAMDGKRVIIRTLDIGADKQTKYFNINKEENPALGMRAIRICLNRPEIFKVQLRAIYRASAYGRIAIMFPMIASLWELRECKRICKAVMAELEREGLPFDKNMETGVMIETPASVFIAEELAREVDFFSIGTNDLTQYLLACDRQNDALDRFFDSRHPAVLRALKIVAEAAHKAGIWVGVCGELAVEPDLLPVFLAIGVDELSVSPSAVLPLRAAIRKSIAKDCTLEKLMRGWEAPQA